jgi:hypothetical protein
MSDAVNPSHYKSHPSGVECIDVVEYLGFNLGNAIKYLWRAGLKENAPTLQDFRKARWYLERATNQGIWYEWVRARGPIDRVLACDPSALTKVIAALVGSPSWHHNATTRSVRRAIEILDVEIAVIANEDA